MGKVLPNIADQQLEINVVVLYRADTDVYINLQAISEMKDWSTSTNSIDESEIDTNEIVIGMQSMADLVLTKIKSMINSQEICKRRLQLSGFGMGGSVAICLCSRLVDEIEWKGDVHLSTFGSIVIGDAKMSDWMRSHSNQVSLMNFVHESDVIVRWLTIMHNINNTLKSETIKQTEYVPMDVMVLGDDLKVSAIKISQQTKGNNHKNELALLASLKYVRFAYKHSMREFSMKDYQRSMKELIVELNDLNALIADSTKYPFIS